jgi:hypothetical protein
MNVKAVGVQRCGNGVALPRGYDDHVGNPGGGKRADQPGNEGTAVGVGQQGFGSAHAG